MKFLCILLEFATQQHNVPLLPAYRTIFFAILLICFAVAILHFPYNNFPALQASNKILRVLMLAVLLACDFDKLLDIFVCERMLEV